MNNKDKHTLHSQQQAESFLLSLLEILWKVNKPVETIVKTHATPFAKAFFSPNN